MASFLSKSPFAVAASVLVVAGSSLYALRRYMNGAVCQSKATLTGKTVIITGANAGIGLETAVDMAQRGARVILACRSAERGGAALEVVKKRSRNEDVAFTQLDLGSLQSVRDFAAKILKDEPRIDILINNAGVMIPPYTKTKDGFELQFGVNHLGHFLLTNLLLDRIKEAPSARIINVSSDAHRQGKINFDDLQSEKSYSRFPAYAQSKLANVLFTRSLAQHLKGSRATTYCVHPGAVNTEGMARHINRLLVYFLYPLLLLLLKTPWQGAQTTIYCAVQEGVEKHSGCYFADCRVKHWKCKKVTSPQDTEDEIAARLWQVSAELVGLDIKK